MCIPTQENQELPNKCAFPHYFRHIWALVALSEWWSSDSSSHSGWEHRESWRRAHSAHKEQEEDAWRGCSKKSSSAWRWFSTSTSVLRMFNCIKLVSGLEQRLVKEGRFQTSFWGVSNVGSVTSHQLGSDAASRPGLWADLREVLQDFTDLWVLRVLLDQVTPLSKPGLQMWCLGTGFSGGNGWTWCS